ncbi:hypothetical protein EDB87DRAFT_1607151 [Lactarius vividus]|nr:hypothetical protein EDB87DRAFT_1607151 [Lactarius vividus]
MSRGVFRWCLALLLGLPHTTTDDDWYNGTFIPKETLNLMYLWHCNYELTSYGDDAKNFRPERYFDANGKAILIPAGIQEGDALAQGNTSPTICSSFSRPRRYASNGSMDRERLLTRRRTLSRSSVRLRLGFPRYPRYCQLRRSCLET